MKRGSRFRSSSSPYVAPEPLVAGRMYGPWAPGGMARGVVEGVPVWDRPLGLPGPAAPAWKRPAPGKR